MPSVAALRHAPWSVSKVKCALRCPLEYRYRYVERIPEPEVAPDARVGKAVHAALESVLGRAPLETALAAGRQLLLLDDERRRYDELAPAVGRFGERIEAFRRRRRVRSELVEHRLAMTADAGPAPFYGRDVFFRGVWDAAFLFDDSVLAVVDHKTGPRRVVTDFEDQLQGYAALAAANLAHVTRVWLGVHFVAEAAMEWTPPVSADEVRREHVPRVLAHVEEAAAAVAGGEYEARPSGWCQRCSYRSICPSARAAAAAGGTEEQGR